MMMMIFNSAGTLLLLLTSSVVFDITDGKLYTQPAEIDLGLTTNLTVNCNFTELESCDIKSPVFLILALRSNTFQTFEDVASVSSQFGTRVTQTNPYGNPTAIGRLRNNGESFLTVVWNDPVANQAGVYKCTLTGLNNASHLVIKEETIEVIAQPPGVDFLIREIVELRHRLNDIETIQEKIKGKMDRAATAMFHFSQVFNGRRYYLSRKLVDNKIHTAEGLCKIFGGYLAEINNWSEYRFVQNVIRNFSGITAVYIGGTDAAHEGHFVFQHSKRSGAFREWGRGQPNNLNGIQDCMVLWSDFSWSMADEDCYDESTSRRFSCEVPMS